MIHLRHKFGLQQERFPGWEAYCNNKCTYWIVCHHWSHRLPAEAKCYSARLPSSLKQITRLLIQLQENLTVDSMLWSWHFCNDTHVWSHFIGHRLWIQQFQEVFLSNTLRPSLPLSKWAMQCNLLFRWPPRHYCHILRRCSTSPKGGIIPRHNVFLIPQPPQVLNHWEKVIPWCASNVKCKGHSQLKFCQNHWIQCPLLTGSS